MLKKLAVRLGISLALGATLLGVGATAAHAETNTCESRPYDHVCNVYQVTATGAAGVNTDYTYGTGWSYSDFYNSNSGFPMIAWIDRSTNNAVTTVYGPYTYGNSDGVVDHTSVWDPGGSKVRACFRFAWATAAVHCTAWY